MILNLQKIQTQYDTKVISENRNIKKIKYKNMKNKNKYKSQTQATEYFLSCISRKKI